jgi:[ribosomal protein S18]-alanine N-acetyltransferase
MPLILRYMQLQDIPQVVTIDHLSFDPPWTTQSYTYEVAESTYSHMVVLELRQEKRLPLWRKLLGEQEQTRQVTAYGGMWHIMDEAHISTIATHPRFRGKGWGEVVLAGMIRKAIHLRANYVVLEVRVSNVTAQNLYRKYAFDTVDLKRGYYHNNGEDAYDMRLNLRDVQKRARFDELCAVARRAIPLADDYNQTDRYRR